MPNYYLGLDLGGTNIKAGIVNSTGKLITHVSLSTGETPRDLSADRVIGRMVDAGERAIAAAHITKKSVKAVGVLSPGQAKLLRGIVVRSANFPLWRNVPLRDKIGRGFGLPAVLENDANAAAYGEWWAGAGREKRSDNLFLFTLGTGVGSGIVYRGEVMRGHFDFAAEAGHMIVVPGGVPCGCGQRGCLEQYCSARYFAQRTAERLEQSRAETSLRGILQSTGVLTSRDIHQHAKMGDAFAMESWDEFCRMLAIGCINICHILDPEVILIGGGASAAGAFLLNPLKKHFRDLWWKMTPPQVQLAMAKLGNDAGIIGAAGVAMNAVKSRRS